jgi:hypothetical protein
MRHLVVAVLAASAVTVATASGCSGQVPTPSAYSTQRYLCDTQHSGDLQAAVDACRAASCPGVFSMTGTLESEPLTVESKLLDTTIVIAANATMRMLDEVKLTGKSPYFQYTFHVQGVGGDLTVPLSAPVSLPIESYTPVGNGRFTDGIVEAGLLLEVGGNSGEEHGLTGTGKVTISQQSETEIVGSFDGAFSTPSDRVRGCFHVFPNTEVVNPLGTM